MRLGASLSDTHLAACVARDPWTGSEDEMFTGTLELENLETLEPWIWVPQNLGALNCMCVLAREY